jgi:hypothetical protein
MFQGCASGTPGQKWNTVLGNLSSKNDSRSDWNHEDTRKAATDELWYLKFVGFFAHLLTQTLLTP